MSKQSSRHRRDSVRRPARRGITRTTIFGVVGVIVALSGIVLVAVLVSRSNGASSDQTTNLAQTDNAAANALIPGATGVPLRVFPTGVNHIVGRERFAVGLIDETGRPVETGAVDFVFLTLQENEGTVTETLTATFQPYGVQKSHTEHEDPNEITGVYVARPTFSAPGPWGVVVRVIQPDGTVRSGQAEFTVTQDSSVPALGKPAIPSTSLTASTPAEAATICSADPADDMHELSIAQAVANGKPTIVLFATPLLCASRTCGPALEAVEDLHHRYRDRVNFIHIEIYPERDGERPSATMLEWQLPSEPWLFAINAGGNIVERLEGGIGISELEPLVVSLDGRAQD